MVPPTSMSSGTLWSHPGSSNVGLDRGSSGNFNPHPFNTTRLESNSAGSGSVVTTNPISDQHYFGVGDYESSNAADPYMVRTHHLEITYYVNFLGSLGSNGFQLK